MFLIGTQLMIQKDGIYASFWFVLCFFMFLIHWFMDNLVLWYHRASASPGSRVDCFLWCSCLFSMTLNRTTSANRLLLLTGIYNALFITCSWINVMQKICQKRNLSFRIITYPVLLPTEQCGWRTISTISFCCLNKLAFRGYLIFNKIVLFLQQ